MPKIIAAINMTIDGFCDHTSGVPDDEVHEHYNSLLRDAGALLYGRTTYQLMESYWPKLAQQPSGNKASDDFALLIDNIPKIVFSRTLKNLTWKNSELKHVIDKEEMLALKQRSGKDLVVGSPGLIVQFKELGLIDEYQLCIHPVIAGKGLTLFKNVNEMTVLKLVKTKVFGAGVVCHYYNGERRMGN